MGGTGRSALLLLEAMRNTAGNRAETNFRCWRMNERRPSQERAFDLIHDSIKHPIFSFFAEEQTPQERDW